MLSLSDNEFSVISFLVRNFSEKLTIRSIAQRLDFSAAGVFNILKKLEKVNIVYGQKFGTGLFYSINFENKIAEHLAAIVLLHSEEKPDKTVFDQAKNFKAVLFDKKTVLVITDNVSTAEISIPNYSLVSKTEEELIVALRKRDADILQLLKKGTALYGEEKIVDTIKKCSYGF